MSDDDREQSWLDELTHRFGGASDEAAIQQLFERTFGVRRSGDGWRWRFVHAPLTPQILLIERAGQLVGHMAFERFATFVDGEPIELLMGGDWMYHPDLRRAGVGRRFYDVYAELYADVPVALGFPSEEAVAAADRRPRAPADQRFELPQWVRWHTGRGVHRSNPRVPVAAGTVAVQAVRALAAVTSAATVRGRRVERGWPAPKELDGLAGRLRRVARGVRVRDGAYLDWRWRRQPDRRWSMLTCRDSAGRLLGWAVAGLDPTVPGTGRVVDLLAEDPATTTALLAAAHRQLGDEGAQVTSCELLDPRPWARRAVLRAGFLHRPGGPVVSAHPLQPGAEALGRPESWYLTRGDTDFA